ncbi:MAG TPA: DUF58 domain-containing protein [Bryobacteraceae bacterium]|nr:DUF58 domain-containing protein [Bryobacteraceae bacterium]
MIVPSSRLVWIAAAVALPAATVAGLAPGWGAAGAAVLGLCAAIAAVDAVLGIERVSKTTVRAPAITRLTKDIATALPVVLENSSGRDLRVRVAIVMPDGVASERVAEELAAPPGEARIDWPTTGLRRGDHELCEAHIETVSPLGLWRARRSQPLANMIRVYPNLRDRATAFLFLRTAEAGLRKRRQVGKGREFENLRHYLPGDSFEDIHWKATARRGFPAVKLYQVEHAQEVYAVIDFSRLAAREGILDSYVDAALHLALVAERQGDRFGLVTFSDRTRHFVRAHRGLTHFRLCRETIYNLRAERVSPDFREVFTNLQVNLRRRALLVFFTYLDDALLAETFEREVPLLARRHVVLVNAGRTRNLKPLFTGEPPADLEGVYHGLAGQMLWNRMRALKLALHNHGVRLSLVDPARIKAQVTAEYLEVKRRQVL